MTQRATILVLCVLSLLYFAPSTAHAVQASTQQNAATGNVEFVYDGAVGLQMAQSVDAPAGASCAGTGQAGALRYNKSINNLEFCNDNKWISFLQHTVPETACNVSLQGRTRFNPTISNVEYCNGSSWVLISNTTMSAAASTEACSPNTISITRYNTSIQDIEVCDGTMWKRVGGSRAIVVDYPTCRLGINGGAELNTYYSAYGAPYLVNTNIVCPKDYVVVSTDDNTVSSIHCCKLKLE